MVGSWKSKEKKKEQSSSIISKESTKIQSKKSSSVISKESTESQSKESSSVLFEESTGSQSKKSSSGINNFYIKYNIDQKIIDKINGDSDKFNLLLELIYKWKKKELKELTRSPFVIKSNKKS